MELCKDHGPPMAIESAGEVKLEVCVCLYVDENTRRESSSFSQIIGTYNISK